MDVVRAAVRVGARALAGSRIHVDPALGEGARRGRGVVRAERGERGEHVLLRLFHGVVQIDRRDERRVQIVVVQLREPHHALAQVQVAVERREIAVHAVDQPRVDRGRNVRAVERPLERALVLPGLRVEHVRLHLPVHGRAERAAEGAERTEEGAHDLFAIGAVRHGAIEAERGAVELDALPVRERHRRKRKVRVGQDAVDVGRRAGHDRRAREQTLFGVGERVLAPAQDVVQVELVDTQPRFPGDELVDRRAIDLENLRFDERRLGAEVRADLRHLLLHALIRADARVLVGHHARVDVDAREVLRQPRRQLERVGKLRRRRTERSLERADRRELFRELLFRGAPRLIARIDLGKVPLVAIRNGAAFFLLRRKGNGQQAGGQQDRQGAAD